MATNYLQDLKAEQAAHTKTRLELQRSADAVRDLRANLTAERGEKKAVAAAFAASDVTTNKLSDVALKAQATNEALRGLMADANRTHATALAKEREAHALTRASLAETSGQVQAAGRKARSTAAHLEAVEKRLLERAAAASAKKVKPKIKQGPERPLAADRVRIKTLESEVDLLRRELLAQGASS